MFETRIDDAEFIEAVAPRVERLAAALNVEHVDGATDALLQALRDFLANVAGALIDQAVAD